MNLVDANVLLYAVNEADPRHEASRRWLDGALSEQVTMAFAWPVLLAFLRLSTKVGLFPNPLPVAAALERVRAWTDQPPSVIAGPTPRHLDLLAGLLVGVGTGGNLVSDAHLAALALEYDATVITYDRDFGRFAGVRWRAPEDAPPDVRS
ncbi:MAG: type II toxin-antitoxin system VapC family toxin [Actinomycetota bacterium]|nr:type II toxin-antitoxin system VapC family toxin [Actinomycetota bacterium]